MNIQTSVVTSPLNWRLYAWAVSVCVHRLAQSGFLHAAAHCSHNNRACSHRQFIVAPNNSVQEKQDATPVDEKSTTLRHALKKLDHYRTLSVANSVAYATCTRTIKALIHDMCVEISRCSCTLNSVWMDKVVKEGQLAKIQYSALQRDW